MNTECETPEIKDCAQGLCQCRPVLGLSGVNSRHRNSQNRFCYLTVREALPLLLALAVCAIPLRQANAQELNNQTVKIWDVATGRELRSWSGEGDTTSVSFSRDGKTVAIGRGDRTVTLLEAGTGRLLHRLKGHTGAVQSIAFSPDGTLLASGSWDRTIKLWDVVSGPELGNLSGHHREVLSVAFAPNAAVLASSSGDGTIRLWNVKTGIALLTLGDYSLSVNSVAFSPDGGVVAAGGDDKTVRLWEVDSGRLLLTLKGHLDAVKAVAFSRDMKYLVSGSRDETIKVWDVSTGRELHTLKGHFSSVDCIACSPDGHTLASASYDKTIRLWDIATGQRIRTLEGHSQKVTGLAFGPDGTTLVSGSALEPAETPSLHILAIGISQTKDRKLNLKFAAKDAKDIVAAFENVGRAKFERITPHLILDEQATRGAIEREFEQIVAEVKPGDTFVFFYSGHDVVSNGGSRGIEPQIYLTPAGIDPRNKNGVVSAGLSAALLQSWFTKIACQHQLVILDASESYRGVEKFVEKIKRENRRLGPLLKRDMMVVAVEGESFEITGHENGFLTRTIVKGLSGETVMGFKGPVEALEKEITTNDLVGLLRSASNIFDETLAMKNAKFTLFKVGADFPIGVISKPIVPKKKKAQEPHQLLPVKFTEMGRPPTMGTDLPRQITYVPGLIETSDSSTSQQTGSPGNGAQDSSAKVVRTGRDYALIIATNNYDQWPHLDNPIADAHSIAEELEKYYGFKTEVVENPNREAILRVLLRYRRVVYAADDQLFIFFAGHGTFLEDFQDGYIIAKDSKRDDELGDSYISHSLLRRVIDSFPCKHILLVLDACFSGTFDELVAKRRGGDEYDPDNEEIIKRRMQFRTRQFLTSGGKEYVPDGRPGQHSPFARKFLEALRSYGGKYGLLTITGVLSYVERGTPPPGRGEWGGNEPGSDFFFVVRMPK